MSDKGNAKRRAETARKRELFGPKRNGPLPIPPEERFWPKVEVAGPEDCWTWKNSVKGPGYGVFWDGEKLVTASSFVLRLKLGRPLQKGEHACHTCDNPSCCNPGHIIVGTQALNMRDKVERGRHHNQLKSHCPQGHEYDMVIHRKAGVRRGCRRCKAESYRRNKLEALMLP